MADEESLAGGMFNGGQTIGSSVEIEGVTNVEEALTDLARAVSAVQASLKKLAGEPFAITRISDHFDKLTKSAETATTAVQGATQAVGGSGGPGTTGGGSHAASRRQATVAIASARPGGGGAAGPYSSPGGPTPPPPPVATSGSYGFWGRSANWLGGDASTLAEMVNKLVMTPIRFTRDAIQMNRQNTQATVAALTPQQFATGQSISEMLRDLARGPGEVYGTGAEMTALFSMLPQLGGMHNYGSGEATGVRRAGLLQGIREAQALNPGAGLVANAATIAGYSANTQAQQQSIMLTGGAFSMIGTGGRQKSLSEWSETVLRWLEKMAGGDIAREGFSYGQLIAQRFPGSNIDAWFNVTGVPPDLREAWWTYVLAKTQQKGGSKAEFDVIADLGQQRTDNVAYQRLRAINESTSVQFRMGGTMHGMYANREQSNRWFNRMMGSVLSTMIPNALASGPLENLQYLPDPIEDMLFGILERLPTNLQTVIGGMGLGLGAMNLFEGTDWGGLFGGGFPMLPGGDVPVGDAMPGAYGPMGGKTLSGLHPDMKRKVGDMMRANPRLRINSGLRDTGMQQRLKSKGVGKVSGKPSMHTRGMEVDLGPKSEYGWIVKNAKRFGLKSGNWAGEPWAVHMGDVDVGDNPINDLVSQMLGGLTNLSGPDGLLGGVSGLLGYLTSWMGEPSTSAPRDFVTDPNLFRDLWRKTQNQGITLQRISVQGGGWPIQGIESLLAGGGANPGPGRLDAQQVANVAFNAGFRGEDLVTAVAIAGRESDFDSNAYNGNASTGDKSYGLWQINMIDSLGPSRRQALGISTNEELFDPSVNARAARMLYDAHTTPFYHWGPYKGKPATYDTDVPEARAAVEAAFPGGYGDVPMPGYTSAQHMPPSVGQTLNFYSTIKVDGGGAGGGLDTRRVASQLADHHEAEMRRRLMRTT